MIDTRERWGLVALGSLAIASCADVVRNTELQPQGPPEVLQVLAQERTEDGELAARVAFGEHPDVDPELDDHAVDDAVAGAEQRVRVVFDELLRGNDLEEILCADGTWSRVPVGTTRHDIADCAGVDLSDCTAVCAGVGIMDANGDLGIDDTRLIDGVASFDCDGVAIPADLDRSYYQPSGNQLVPAGPLGLEGLGPALVLVPRDDLPTSARCRLALADEVVDRDGEAPCAGDPCTPGGLDAIELGIEPLLVLATDPADGANDVAPTAEPASLTVGLNVAVDPASLDAVTVTAAGAAVVAELAVSADDPRAVVVTLPDGLAAAATYELTLAGVTDRYGGALPAPVTVSFTTRSEP